MTRTTMRWTTAGALTLAAAGMASVALPGSRTAEAAAANPFAGAYEGTGPVTTGVWQVDVSSRGSVSAATTSSFFGYNWRTKLTGTIAADGSFSYKVETTASGHSKGFFRDARLGADPEAPIADSFSTVTTGTATLTENADGSVTGTGSDGVAIAWLPR